MNDLVVVAQYKVMEYNRAFPTTIQNSANKFQPQSHIMQTKKKRQQKGNSPGGILGGGGGILLPPLPSLCCVALSQLSYCILC